MKRLLLTLLLLGAASLLFAGCAGIGSQSQRTIVGSYRTNGARIYYSGTSENGPISYTGGAPGMMGGSGGMMGGSGRLACADCHGKDARGGLHQMGMTQMDAPDIRWSALTEEEHGAEGGHDEGGGAQMEHPPYDENTFKLAVTQGVDPAGEPLDPDMPRWRMSDQDIQDLIEFLKSMP